MKLSPGDCIIWNYQYGYHGTLIEPDDKHDKCWRVSWSANDRLSWLVPGEENLSSELEEYILDPTYDSLDLCCRQLHIFD